MGSLKVLLNHQNRFIVVAVASVVALMIPILASAAQITQRSIALSSSSKTAEGVTYDVTFTAAGAATGFVVEFCSNTPLVGQSCDAPVGMDASGATSADATLGTNTANKVVGAAAIAAGANSITLDNITNPDEAGTIYARILTFNGGGEATYLSQTPGTYVDNGSVALSITDTVRVSGAVLETLTFCAAGDTGSVDTNDGIAANCADAADNAPVLALGEGVPKALTSSTVSSGDIYAQISTNAANGAVVRLKSSADGCGGLMLTGSSACNIAPATADIQAGDALFGVRVAAATDPASSNGTFQAANGYSAASYLMNYTSGADPATGVTSVYGDAIMNTNGDVASNKNMKLTFGASISNQTPAGLYSADLSLIATGTF